MNVEYLLGAMKYEHLLSVASVLISQRCILSSMKGSVSQKSELAVMF